MVHGCNRNLDISKLESIKESTKQTAALQMRILNKLGPLLIEDKTGKIIFVNPAALTLLKIDAYRIIGLCFLDLLPQNEYFRLNGMINRLKASSSKKTANDTPDTIKFETYLIQTGKMIHVLVNYSIMKTNDTLEGSLITLNDISDIKALTKTIQERSNELIQAEKMASIGLLASGVAHELNNPLSYIISNTNTLENYIKSILSNNTKINLDEIKNDIFEIIESNRRGLNRLAEVIADLRMFSHSHTSEDLELRKMDIQHPIKIALNLLSYELKNIKVTFNYKEKLFIAGTPKIHQVFLNIIHNAIQSINKTKKQGKITITTQEEKEMIKIQIADNGSGFSSEEELTKIFEPFFTTKDPGVGTGLGLSISRRIINDHSGYIEAEPANTKGAVFSIYLPKFSDKCR